MRMPLHHHFSYLTIADFAAAAARAERPLEASTLLEQALARLDPAPGPRLDQLAGRARGLLAEPAGAEPHFAAPWPIPRGAPGRSSGLSFSLTTGSGCDGNGGSGTPSPSSGTLWKRSAASARRRGRGARNPNCAPAV
jgi:hypothetical protein